MKSLFQPEAYSEVKQRIENIDANTTPKWGKMNAGQMMAHCQKPLEVPLKKSPLKRPGFFTRLLFKSFKKAMYNDTPWKQGLPTAKGFAVTDERDFEKEKATLVGLIDEFHEKGENHNWMNHPAFGKFSAEQWGKMQYKHLDHHLRQFGV
jgi:hypothetical protein